MLANSLIYALAFALEQLVADRQRLVDDQDVGVGMGADRESDARHHALE